MKRTFSLKVAADTTPEYLLNSMQATAEGEESRDNWMSEANDPPMRTVRVTIEVKEPNAD